jgi:hypothetical protein
MLPVWVLQTSEPLDAYIVINFKTREISRCAQADPDTHVNKKNIFWMDLNNLDVLS